MQSEQNEVNHGAVVIGFPVGGKRVKADVEDGYTKLANELLEAICGLSISSRKLRVLMAIVRKTYGYHKKFDRISSTKIGQLVGCSATNVRTDIAELKRQNLLVQSGEMLGPNPVISEWSAGKKEQPKSIKSDAHSIKTDAPTASESMLKNGEQKSQIASESMLMSINPDANRASNLMHTKDKRNISKEKGGAIQESLLPNTPDQPEKKSRKKPGKPIDPNFQITGDMLDWMTKRGITVDPSLETEKFVNYFLANGKLYSDWAATWRNWMLKAQQFAARSNYQPRQPVAAPKPRRMLADSMPASSESKNRPTPEQRRALRIEAGLEPND